MTVKAHEILKGEVREILAEAHEKISMSLQLIGTHKY